MGVVQYLAVAASVAAPTVLAQTAAAPAGMWPSCAEKLAPNETHSLLDIVTVAFTAANAGKPSVLLPLVEGVEPETLELLADFDVAGEGYTLLLPFNMDKMGIELLTAYPELNSTAILKDADDIIRAHIIPETILFPDLQKKTNKTGEYTVESLQGFEWTFGWMKGENATEGGGFPFIVDLWEVTDTGMIEIQMDIRNQPDCPNRVIGLNGFVVTPDLLPAETPLPVPAEAPEPVAEAPVPLDAPAPATDSTTHSVSRSLLAASIAGAAALALLLI